jgi:hypothetical protein
MDESLVFEKTPQGQAEVGSRSAGLSLQARRVLIMVDGSRTLGELAPLAPQGRLDEVIELLSARGLIRSTGNQDAAALAEAWNTGPVTSSNQALSASTRDSGAAPAAPDDRIYLTFDEVKRRAVHELNERLGPDGEPLAVRIERSNTAEDLRDRLREAERLIARTVGEASAQEFVRAMRKRPA